MKHLLILATMVSLIACKSFSRSDPNYYKVDSLIAPDGEPAWRVYSFDQAAWKCPKGYEVVESMLQGGSEEWLIRCN